MMRSMWICLESLRNSMWELVESVGAWVRTCVAEDPDDGHLNYKGLWQLLGFTDHWLELLVQTRLRFRAGKLLVETSSLDVKYARN